LLCLALSWFQSNAQNDKGLVPQVPLVGTTRRLALAIGNKDYPWRPLTNPINDATDVAAALKLDGFEVHLVTNAKEREMKAAIRKFTEAIRPGDFAFVYYSGHGVEVKGTNYLLPIDMSADASEYEVEDEAVSAQRIVGDLNSQGAGVEVLVLDACRDNPLRANRSTGGGLAPMEGLGSLVVFATQAGRTASDNTEGHNGLFTKYLLKALQMNGVSFDDAVRNVARQMAAETNRKQVPAIYGLLETPVYLAYTPNPPDLAQPLVGNGGSYPTSTQATLVVSCDIQCRWKLDGVEKGVIEPGDAASAVVVAGEHLLMAESVDGRDRTTKTITGSAGQSRLLSFALKDARERRGAAAAQTDGSSHPQVNQSAPTAEQHSATPPSDLSSRSTLNDGATISCAGMGSRKSLFLFTDSGSTETAGSVLCGSSVRIEKVDQLLKWSEVITSSGRSGWILNQFLTQKAAFDQASGHALVDCSLLPGRKSLLLFTDAIEGMGDLVTCGSAVSLLDKDVNRYKIRTKQGREGWLPSEYIKVID
jgi:hypothetical protein